MSDEIWKISKNLRFTIGRFLLLSLLFLSTTESFESKVDYLVNLIEAKTEEALRYSLPNDANDYRPRSGRIDESVTTYDHIVIGAGAAGAIVATRLSENRNKKVLLLEAGGFQTNPTKTTTNEDQNNSFSDLTTEHIEVEATDDSVGATKLSDNTDKRTLPLEVEDSEIDFLNIPPMNSVSLSLQYNWNYQSVVQNNICQSSQNGRCSLPAGKGLGGSTIVNGLMYARGCKKDYDNWNISRWNYENVLPYFKKFENYQIPGDANLHGYSGPVHVAYSQPLNLETSIFLDASRELGQDVGDYNGNNPLRAGRVQMNTIRGQRCGTRRAYIQRVWGRRPNLHISPRSYVTKILIDKDKRACGVLYVKNRRLFVAKSNKEIVLSAGSYKSPQLLMLSGIGPKDHLESLNITVIQNLPVGKLLKDHVAFGRFLVSTNYSDNEADLRDQVQDYLRGIGPLTTVGAVGIAFLKSNHSTAPQRPDIEIIMGKGNPALADLNDNSATDGVLTIVPIVLHPKSYGSVMLRSSNPFEYPLIDPNYFSDTNGDDARTLLEGIKYSLRLIDTEPFKKINATLIALPGCTEYVYLSDEYFYCQIKYFGIAFNHPIGTCKMGASPSVGAVVDHNLRVHGIDNLMVADASVMPDTMSGHTSAPSMMIGEKAASIIVNKQL